MSESPETAGSTYVCGTCREQIRGLPALITHEAAQACTWAPDPTTAVTDVEVGDLDQFGRPVLTVRRTARCTYLLIEGTNGKEHRWSNASRGYFSKPVAA